MLEFNLVEETVKKRAINSLLPVFLINKFIILDAHFADVAIPVKCVWTGKFLKAAHFFWQRTVAEEKTSHNKFFTEKELRMCLKLVGEKQN